MPPDKPQSTGWVYSSCWHCSPVSEHTNDYGQLCTLLRTSVNSLWNPGSYTLLSLFVAQATSVQLLSSFHQFRHHLWTWHAQIDQFNPKHSHLLGFSFRSAAQSFPKAACNHCRCSLGMAAKMTISSRYIIHHCICKSPKQDSMRIGKPLVHLLS